VPLSAHHIALSRLLRQSVIIPRIETARGGVTDADWELRGAHA